VGLRAGLDTRLEEIFFASVEDRTPVVQSVVRYYSEQPKAELQKDRISK
jgi:hypothetical protein